MIIPLESTGHAAHALLDRSNWRFVLASDLDGTFLGGTRQMRRDLYQWIARNRKNIGLIFVTGRDADFISDLCDSGEAPWPDYIIGDVGTTIAHVDPLTHTIMPIDKLEAHIRAAWNNGETFVRETLSGASGLTPQDTPFRYRVSYHWDPDSFEPQCIAPIEAAGFDVLISHGCFLDVLPRGISKGPSLLRLLTTLSIPHDRVLVAGDTLNDLSMFETGLRGAVVGEAEAALLEATQNLPLAYRCAAPGAGGIMEAIRVFDLYPELPGGLPTGGMPA